ncbi:MAG TPA: acyl-CoA dehydrogenase family protein [Pirellulales bacterium]|nr:acyl-CoA dehydrogenase family protein [Pirellulales bacterium]
MSPIRSPDEPAFEELCRLLAADADALDAAGAWPQAQLARCGEQGAFGWFVPQQWGGQGWDEERLIRAFLRLGGACLATAFVLTQPQGASRRIAASENEALKSRLLPSLARGETLATVGISQLTTSRRHLARPMLAARETPTGFVLDGLIPWVTGGAHADYIVTGAVCDDGRQILAVLPTALPGVTPLEPARLVGLSSTHTGEVRCEGVELGAEWLLAGPVENVLSQGKGAGTGGLQTSALALGLADAALTFFEQEAAKRSDLAAAAESLRREHAELQGELLAAVAGRAACSQEELRSRANSVALRSSQAALTAAKGTGYVVGHPAGRWCREALFFLVWSCPQPVMAAALCELAGLSD